MFVFIKGEDGVTFSCFCFVFKKVHKANSTINYLVILLLNRHKVHYISAKNKAAL